MKNVKTENIMSEVSFGSVGAIKFSNKVYTDSSKPNPALQDQMVVVLWIILAMV